MRQIPSVMSCSYTSSDMLESWVFDAGLIITMHLTLAGTRHTQTTRHLCKLVQTFSIFKTCSFTRGSFHGFITCRIPVCKLMLVSQFHIHHGCQSKCGVQRESLLKEQNRRLYGFDWSGGNQRRGMHCRCERVVLFFYGANQWLACGFHI